MIIRRLKSLRGTKFLGHGRCKEELAQDGRASNLIRVPEIYATGMHRGLTGSEFRLAALSRSVCRGLSSNGCRLSVCRLLTTTYQSGVKVLGFRISITQMEIMKILHKDGPFWITTPCDFLFDTFPNRTLRATNDIAWTRS